MSDISLVYVGQFDRAPFFGGMYWFDNGVPLQIRGDLAAQLLFTVTPTGDRQFQVETQADFERMLAEGYIAPGTLSEGLVWTPPQPAVVATEAVVSGLIAPVADEAELGEPAIAAADTVDTDAQAADAPATDEAAPKQTGRRRGASA